MALVQDRDRTIEATNELHIVLNHQNGVVTCQRFKEISREISLFFGVVSATVFNI
jgi:hypothetical protein